MSVTGTSTTEGPPSKTTLSPAVDVRGLRKVYRSRRRGDTVAVDGVSFSVSPGEVVGLLGPNGAGKTTTIKCLCTLVKPDGGSITIDGIDARRRPKAAVGKVAAVLEGNRNVYWRLTPTENLEFFASLNGIATRSVRGLIDELLERFDLTEKAKSPVLGLSKGMQQKLAVACAFVKQTPVLFLDEPTLGLDVEASHDLRTQLKNLASEGSRTVLVSSHDMDVVQEICERVIIIQDGKIVTDDRIDNLLELFKARRYRFRIAGSISDSMSSGLRAAFPNIELKVDSHESEIEVELLASSKFYELVDVLRSFDSVIESVDQTDPDLEEIFLRIVREGRQ